MSFKENVVKSIINNVILKNVIQCFCFFLYIFIYIKHLYNRLFYVFDFILINDNYFFSIFLSNNDKYFSPIFYNI